jgi:CheY-like chemotaxis protein
MDDSGVILLVEDIPNDVELTLAALGENRPTPGVVVASDGEKALNYLFRRGDHGSRPAANPRVVLLDLKLPKVDGLEVLECIKTDPHMSTIPVMILTSSREEGDLPRSYDLGTNAYVVKPASYERFIEVPGEVGLLWDSLNQLPSTVDLDR